MSGILTTYISKARHDSKRKGMKTELIKMIGESVETDVAILGQASRFINKHLKQQNAGRKHIIWKETLTASEQDIRVGASRFT